MKKIVITALAMCFAGISSLYSQDVDTTGVADDQDLLSGFQVEPASHEHTQSNSYKALGIGYTGTLFFNKVDKLNEMLKELELPDLSLPIYLHGFNSFLALEPTGGFSIGFNYSAGSKTVDKKLSGELADYTRYLSYRVGFTSVDLNFAFLPFKDFAILTGVSMAYSTLKIESYQTKSEYKFDNKFEKNSDPNRYFNSYDGTFYTAQPHLTLQYKLASNFLFKASGGYNFSFSPDWKLNRESKIKNMPTDIKPDGMSIDIGLSIGIFDF
jgi:hypothetical protein